MSCRWWITVVTAVLMTFAGCSDDTSTNDGNDNQWDLDGDAAHNDVDEGGDAGTVDDTGQAEDTGTSDDTGTEEDTGSIEDTGPIEDDVDPDEDTDPPPPDELSEDMLIGEPWYGVWRLTDDPAITGLYVGIEFIDEEDVVLRGEEDLTGNWEILGSGDVHLYNLEGDFEQLMLEADMGSDGLDALEIFTPADHVDPYTARYEQRGEAGVDFDDLRARWQSTERITTEDGTEVYLALRIDADGFMEIGAVGDEGVFWGFLGGPGVTQTFDTGETFWAMLIATDDEGAPVAGELRGEGDEMQLFMFTEDHDDQSGGGPPGGGASPELIVVELEAVDQFGD